MWRFRRAGMVLNWALIRVVPILPPFSGEKLVTIGFSRPFPFFLLLLPVTVGLAQPDFWKKKNGLAGST